jgi:hypothetical protein
MPYYAENSPGEKGTVMTVNFEIEGKTSSL